MSQLFIPACIQDSRPDPILRMLKQDGLLGRASFFYLKFCGTIVGKLQNYPALLLGIRLLTCVLIITPPATGLFELIKLHHFTNLWHHNGLP